MPFAKPLAVCQYSSTGPGMSSSFTEPLRTASSRKRMNGAAVRGSRPGAATNMLAALRKAFFAATLSGSAASVNAARDMAVNSICPGATAPTFIVRRDSVSDMSWILPSYSSCSAL